MNSRFTEAFDKIQAEAALKNHTHEFLSSQRKKKNPSFALPVYRLAAAAACLLCLIIGLGGYQAYFTTASAISIDINPSIELSINRFDRVISVHGYNDDGRTLANSLSLRFLDYESAIDTLLSSEAIAPYLSRGNVISITVAGDTLGKSEEILTRAESCVSSHHKQIHCSFSSIDEMNAAHTLGLSFGKYQAFLELQALSPEITPADIEDLTMKEIYNIINELSASSDDSSSDSDNNDSSSGNNASGCDAASGHGHHHSGSHH